MAQADRKIGTEVRRGPGPRGLDKEAGGTGVLEFLLSPKRPQMLSLAVTWFGEVGSAPDGNPGRQFRIHRRFENLLSLRIDPRYLGKVPVFLRSQIPVSLPGIQEIFDIIFRRHVTIVKPVRKGDKLGAHPPELSSQFFLHNAGQSVQAGISRPLGAEIRSV